MKPAKCLAVAVALAILVGARPETVTAQAPSSPSTVWSFLGIPQGMQKMRDTMVNRRGNLPKLERKPPLKRIADPANLEAENPAIKAAAKIKTEEDLAAQKIKAIKYLADVGCGCYPGVEDALLKALDDCTEEVRYEAAIALCEASGNPCDACGGMGCCSAAVMSKLQEKAHGTDAQGCSKEASVRVRAAAENALNACRMLTPETPAEPEEKIEYPREAPPIEVPPDEVSPFIEERGLDEKLPPAPPAGDQANELSGPIRLTSSSSVGVSMISDSTPCGCAQGCCPGPCPSATDGGYLMPDESGRPSQLGTEAAGDAGADVSPDWLAGSFGAAAGPSSAAPYMIGDFFGMGASFVDMGYHNTTVAVAGGDRRFKIVESNSPIPTDRLFFNYHHFQNALFDALGDARPLDRYTFGVEKTFWNRRCSVELRVPFSGGLASDQHANGLSPLGGNEFGNLAMAVKGVLRRRPCYTLAAGLGIVFPTGSDSEFYSDGGYGQEFLAGVVRNESLHLQPFLGLHWEPRDRVFVLLFTQFDFDANGSRVEVPMARTGVQTYSEQNLWFVDAGVGYWLYENPRGRFLTGIAPVVEIHYSTTLQDTDLAGDPLGARVTNLANRVDVLNITGGLHFQMGNYSTLTVAAVAPLRSEDNALFDAELAVQFTRRF